MEELFYPLKHIASIFAILRKTLNYTIMKNFLILSLLLAFLTTEVCAQWKPAGDKIKTQWANKINTSAVLPEYPRPIMERNEWKNLNGLWEYAITDL